MVLEIALKNQTQLSDPLSHSLFLHWLDHSETQSERLAHLPNSSLVVQLRHQASHEIGDAWKVLSEKEYFFPDDRVLTLGERRARARIPTAKTIEQFMYDPDKLVIQNLLMNPRMTEGYVLRMASRRPTAATALTAIVASKRYGLSKAVMLALVQNPYTPYRLALGLTYLLSKTELMMLAEVESLSPLLKQYIRRRCARWNRSEQSA